MVTIEHEDFVPVTDSASMYPSLQMLDQRYTNKEDHILRYICMLHKSIKLILGVKA